MLQAFISSPVDEEIKAFLIAIFNLWKSVESVANQICQSIFENTLSQQENQFYLLS